jgi:hypothetical protein
MLEVRRLASIALVFVCVVGTLAEPLWAGVVPEFYTDRAAFETRLAEFSTVDFEDIDTGTVDPAPFSSDRYLDSKGIVITGEDGQYASRHFQYPAEYPPVSGVNIYAPGPIAEDGGGNYTDFTFFYGGTASAVAGFGAYFIDADWPDLGQCSLAARDDQGALLAIDDDISGANASQLFRGIVMVDDSTGEPTPVIASVHAVTGNGWPAGWNNEGVVLDDLIFGTPAATGMTPPITDATWGRVKAIYSSE